MQHAPEPPIKDPAQEDASKADALRIYSMEDVEKHDTRDSAWFVHKGQVRFTDSPSSACVQAPQATSLSFKAHLWRVRYKESTLRLGGSNTALDVCCIQSGVLHSADEAVWVGTEF